MAEKDTDRQAGMGRQAGSMGRLGRVGWWACGSDGGLDVWRAGSCGGQGQVSGREVGREMDLPNGSVKNFLD